MRLAVFDTNVIVSAGLKPGSIPARLVMDWVLAGQMQLVTCPSVIRNTAKLLRARNLPAMNFRQRGWSY